MVNVARTGFKKGQTESFKPMPVVWGGGCRIFTHLFSLPSHRRPQVLETGWFVHLHPTFLAGRTLVLLPEVYFKKAQESSSTLLRKIDCFSVYKTESEQFKFLNFAFAFLCRRTLLPASSIHNKVYNIT